MAQIADCKDWWYIKSIDKPLLSICITTYNRAKWLTLNLKTLMGCIKPFEQEIEVIVCDNASTDDTPKVVEPYLKAKNFRYYRNLVNVGMLGNLKVTAHHAQGQYVWVIGDDDIIKTNAVESVVSAINKYSNVSLIYLNYSYTRISDADDVKNMDEFLMNSIPIVPPGPDQYALIKDISTNSENFFTAIYCLIFRRDHALRAYSQYTGGRPFSTMLTCIPTSYYVCNYMFEEAGVWIGEPAVVVNMNVSWLNYAPLWVLERIPELYDLAELKGADPDAVDKWRTHNFPGVLHYLNEIYFNDKADNKNYFSIDRLIQRHKHISVFKEKLNQFMIIYQKAYSTGKLNGSLSPDTLIKRYGLNV